MKHLYTFLALIIGFSINAQISTSGTNNTGNDASAMGLNTLASGDASTAMGGFTQAISFGSTAMGGYTTASGDFSTAMGGSTTASDFASLVIGRYNSSGSSVTSSATAFSTANTAFVIGNGTGGNASDAFKVMFNGDAYVYNTLYLGGTAITSTAAELNILSGVTSTSAELNLNDGSSAGTVVNSKAVVYGSAGEVNATTLQIAGTAITSTAAELNLLNGVTTIGSGILGSVTEGSNTGVRLSTSTAANHGNIGSNAVDLSYQANSSSSRGATGRYSTAAGEATTASGESSTALGYYSVASGGYGAIAMGNQTRASGNNSTVMGEGGTASGAASTAMGRGTKASDYASLVIGQYNSSGSSVTSNATAFSTANTAFVIGNGVDGNASDAFKVLFNGDTTVSNDLTVNGDVVVSSDARLKANIVSLGSTLARLLLIDGKSYTMKKDGKQKIGVLAQDIQKVFPELVSEDSNEMLAVNYQGLVPVLINALKEQDDKISRLEVLVEKLMSDKKQ
jgi:hypothetical protein